jgi:hypothetical protein
MKLEAASFYETLVPIYQTTRRHVADDRKLHSLFAALISSNLTGAFPHDAPIESGPTQPPIKWIQEALCQDVKRAELVADRNSTI